MGDLLLRAASWVLGGMGSGVAAATVASPLGAAGLTPIVAAGVLIMTGWCGLSLAQLWRPTPAH
jgi:hypothetical protein